METINGFTIIASHPRGFDAERVILGVVRHVRPDGQPDDVEYVTAIAKLGPVTSWYWGHYFGGYAPESSLFLAAVADFRERAEIVEVAR
jgi:hypothetical protein